MRSTPRSFVVTGQRFFRQSFEQFSARMVPAYRIHKGTALLKRHAGLLAQIERQYGVPGPIVVAIGGLEGDFGAATGKLPTIQALATLAYDCRRSELFTQNLFDALRIVQRGDLRPAEMRGASGRTRPDSIHGVELLQVRRRFRR